MKFLMLTNSDRSHGEYLSDMVLHGFRLSDHEIIEYPRTWYMYKADLTVPGFDPIGHISGNGFTIFGTLPDDSDVDRNDIENKIKNSYFDYVMLQRCDFNYELEHLVFEYYPANKIILLDGHDTSSLFNHRVGKGIYFKRELQQPIDNIYPISFAFPKEKIEMYSIEKSKLLSNIIPGEATLGTYKYTTEESYYKEYAQSCFAHTMKKSGWDCMRHYEIMANGCLPIFKNIQHCPQETMKTLPKEMFVLINEVVSDQSKLEKFINSSDEYGKTLSDMMEHFRKHCTTEKLTEYIVETVVKINA